MKLFTEHPASVGESYAEHFSHAAGFGLSMLLGGVACLLHALVPCVCVSTGSRIISRLHERMVIHRRSLTRDGTRSRDALGAR